MLLLLDTSGPCAVQLHIKAGFLCLFLSRGLGIVPSNPQVYDQVTASIRSLVLLLVTMISVIVDTWRRLAVLCQICETTGVGPTEIVLLIYQELILNSKRC